AVDVHVLETRLAVEAARPDIWVVVADAVPAEVFELLPRGRRETDRVGVVRARIEPRITALVILHELRRVLLVLLGKVVLPDVGGLRDVNVGRDDLVVHWTPPDLRGYESPDDGVNAERGVEKLSGHPTFRRWEGCDEVERFCGVDHRRIARHRARDRRCRSEARRA